MHALQSLGVLFRKTDQAVDHSLVAAQAIGLKDLFIAPGDHDGLVKILESESLGVAVAIIGFGDVLGNEIRGKVAIHTAGHPVVTGFLPGIKLRLHDMAIDAGARVLAEIGKPFRVVKRKKSKPHHNPHQDSKNDPLLPTHDCSMLPNIFFQRTSAFGNVG